MAHEALDAVLPAMPGVTHARADDGLQIERQPLLRAAGDVVQVEPNGPQELPGAPAVAGFLLRQDPAQIGQFAHGLGVEHVARDPVQRLQVAQPAAAFLDIGLDDKRAVAIAAVPHRALGLLGGDVFGRARFLAGGAEAAVKLAEQGLVAGQEARVEQRRADRRVLGALHQAIPDRPRRMADLQAEVPQEIQHVFDDAQRLGWRVLFGQEQQVDIAERRQHAAAIAAGGGDAKMLRRSRVRLSWWYARRAPPPRRRSARPAGARPAAR